MRPVIFNFFLARWTPEIMKWSSRTPRPSIEPLCETSMDPQDFLHGPPLKNLWIKVQCIMIILTIVELKSRSVWNNTVFYDGMRIIKISCVKMNQACLSFFCFSQQTMARDVIGKSLELKTSV